MTKWEEPTTPLQHPVCDLARYNLQISCMYINTNRGEDLGGRKEEKKGDLTGKKTGEGQMERKVVESEKVIQ